MPLTYHVKSCFVSLCPVVFSIIKDSLCAGVVPAAFKIAVVTPVPKKTNIDYENLKYFVLFPISLFLLKFWSELLLLS